MSSENLPQLEKQSHSDLENSLDHDNDASVNEVDANAQVIKDRGVFRIEGLLWYFDTHKRGILMKGILGTFVLLVAWAIALRSSVTGSLQPLVTSYYQDHSSGLGSLTIAISIITAISQPIWARIANIVSRPALYLIGVLLFTVGYIIAAASKHSSAYIVGLALGAAGYTGIDFLDSLLAADLTRLIWRGLATSILSTPYIINVWYAGDIVSDLEKTTTGWRWGYGMFCIIIPVLVVPALVILMFYERKAQNEIPESKKLHYKNDLSLKTNWKTLFWRVFLEVDVMGLLLLGFGFSLILLPLSLYSKAKDTWRNPSIIAMFIVGGILLIGLVFYEAFVAPFPIIPRRVLNRTLVCAIVADTIYQLAGMILGTFLSSYVYVVKDWSVTNWTYYNNTLTLALCIFGVVAGLLLRVVHRYKVFQFFGIICAILGSGVVLRGGRKATVNTPSLVWSSTLHGIGGGFNVVATGVGLQASVPHRDLALSMAILSLFSFIGQAIGEAISTAIWTGILVKHLRSNLPSSVSDETINELFLSIEYCREFSMNSVVRKGTIMAYREVFFILVAIEISLQVIRLVAVSFQSNYYLGDQLNAVEKNKEGVEGLENELLH